MMLGSQRRRARRGPLVLVVLLPLLMAVCQDAAASVGPPLCCLPQLLALLFVNGGLAACHQRRAAASWRRRGRCACASSPGMPRMLLLAVPAAPPLTGAATAAAAAAWRVMPLAGPQSGGAAPALSTRQRTNLPLIAIRTACLLCLPLVCTARQPSARLPFRVIHLAPAPLPSPPLASTPRLTLRPPMSRFRSVRHCGVVMSSVCVMTPRMGLMGIRSTPMIVDPLGMYLAATCSHPPGAAHRSMTHPADARKSYFLFSWMSLKAERAR